MVEGFVAPVVGRDSQIDVGFANQLVLGTLYCSTRFCKTLTIEDACVVDSLMVCFAEGMNIAGEHQPTLAPQELKGI